MAKPNKESDIKLSDLIPDDKNFNKGSEYGNGLIEKSFSKFGAGRSILIDKNNRIIAGNKSVENAMSIGLDDVQIVESDGKRIIAVKRMDIDLDTPQGREMALADNASAKANIVFDAELIEAELGEATAVEWGIEVADKLEAEEDDFDAPEGGIETDIVLGDLFEIGEHRLLCGDSTDSDSVAKLMDGQKADMVFTDPMYQDSPLPIISIFNTLETNYFLIMATFKQCMSFVNDSGFRFRFDLVFNQKVPSSTMNKKVPYYLHKNLIYLTKDDSTIFDCDNAKGFFSDAGYYPSIIESAKNTSEVHGLTKNSDGIVKILSGFRCKSILDLFIGSGTTMVAAHQLKRKCYGMELDTKYCQVIVDRMIKLDPSLEIKKNGVKYEHTTEA